jgi:rRNA maturation RNase YbeY
MVKSKKVHFFYQGVTISLGNRNRLKLFLEKLFEKEGKKLMSLNYIFCTDKALLKINKEYLRHDYYTDIISFDLSDNPHEKTAEIYISVDRVRENAKSLGVSVQLEILRVIFHGALHICNYKDKTKREINLMRKMEDTYIKSYNMSVSRENKV